MIPIAIKIALTLAAIGVISCLAGMWGDTLTGMKPNSGWEKVAVFGLVNVLFALTVAAGYGLYRLWLS